MGKPTSIPRRILRALVGGLAGLFGAILVEAIVLYFAGRYQEGPYPIPIMAAGVLVAGLAFAYGHRRFSFRAAVFSWIVISGVAIGFFLGYFVYPPIALSRGEQSVPKPPSGKRRAPYEIRGIALGVTMGALSGTVVGVCILPLVRIRSGNAV